MKKNVMDLIVLFNRSECCAIIFLLNLEAILKLNWVQTHCSG